MQQCEQWDTTLNVIIFGQIHFFTVIGQYINSKVFFLSNFRRKKVPNIKNIWKRRIFLKHSVVFVNSSSR